MALIKIGFFPQSLMRHTEFHLILPNDASPMEKEGNPHYEREIKTMLLLHGYCGASIDWLCFGNIWDISKKYNLAIILPSGENSFYLDGRATGSCYARYVGEELIDYVRKTFGIAGGPEDTFTAGLSMGGFGAIHTALKYNKTFGKAVGLSSAMIVNNIKNIREGFTDMMANYAYYESVFGKLSELDNSENNPEYLIKKLRENNERIPELYMACGTEDFLIEENRSFRDFLVANDVAVSYHESAGVHDWRFWNENIEPAVKWLLG